MSNPILNPYVGPRTFREEESKRFFGREREARELLSLVLSEQLVLFYAQSGAGKSSLLNTTLIPKLKEKGFKVLPVGRVSGDADVEVNNIYVFNLLRTLSPTEEKNLTALSKQPLTDFFAELNDTSANQNIHDAGDKIFLIIDQFEEIFTTHTEEWAKREDFFKQINLILQDNPNLWILFAMREDYIASLDPFTALLPGRLRTRYYMQQLERDAALNAIRGPVVSDGFSRPYASGVAEKLVDDLCSIRVTLPDGTISYHSGQFIEPLILQVICYNIWGNLRSEGTEITTEDLQDVGDVNQFLKSYYAKRVNTVAQTGHVSERKIRKWFSEKLISNTGIRNMVLHEPSGLSSGLENEIIMALPDLVRQQQRGGAMFYELSHDRLVNLIVEDNKDWEDKNTSYLQKQASLWAENGRLESRLISSKALEEAEQWVQEHPNEVTAIDLEFLNASKKRKKFKQRITLLSIVASLFVIVFVFIFSQGNQALANAKKQEDIAKANALSRIALDTSDRQLDLAILLGLEAYGIDLNAQTENTLLTVLQKVGNLVNFAKLESKPKYVEMLPNGQGFAILADDGVSILGMDGKRLSGPYTGIPSPAYSTAFSPNGQVLAASSKDGTITLWDVNNGEQIGSPIEVHTDWVNQVLFTSDSRTLISVSDDHLINLLNIGNLEAPKKLQTIELNDGVNDAVISSKNILAATNTAGEIYLFDLLNLESNSLPTPAITGSDIIFQLAIHPNGNLLAYGDLAGTLYLTDITNVNSPKELIAIPTNSVIYQVVFSSNGEMLAIGDSKGNISIYDVTQPAEATLLKTFTSAHQSAVFGLVFNLNGEVLVSAGEDGQIIFWDWANEKKLITKKGVEDSLSSSPVNSLSLNPKGNILAIALENGNVLLWDVSDIKNIQHLITIQGDSSNPTSFVVNPDGKHATLFTSVPFPTFDLEIPLFANLENNTKTQFINTELIFQTQDNLVILQKYENEFPNKIIFYDLEKDKLVFQPVEGNYLGISDDEQILIYQTYDENGVIPTLHLIDLKAGGKETDSLRGDYLSMRGNVLAYNVLDELGNRVTDDKGLPVIGLLDINDEKNAQISGEYVRLLNNSQILISRYETDQYKIYKASLDPNIPKQSFETEAFDPQPYFSDNEKYILINSYQKDSEIYELKIYDVATTKSVFYPITSSTPLSVLWLSENGRFLVASSYDQQSMINVYDASYNTLIENFAGELNQVLEIDHYLMFQAYDYNKGTYGIHLYDIKSNKAPLLIEGSYLNLIRDGAGLIYYTNEGINLWDTNLNKNLTTSIEGSYLGVSVDEKFLYTLLNDKILTWNLEKTWPLGEPITDLAFASDVIEFNSASEKTAWVGETGIHVTEANSVKEVLPPFNAHHTNQIGSLDYQFSPHGKTLTFFDSNRDWNVLDISSGAAWFRGEGYNYGVFSQDGKWLAIVDNITSTTSIWNTETYSLVIDQIEGTSPVFSLNTDLVAVSDVNANTTSVWDIKQGIRLVSKLKGYFADFSKDGEKLFVQNFDDQSMLVWDVKKQTQRKLDTRVTNFVISPDNRTIVVTDDSKFSITAWDIETNTVVAEKLKGTVVFFNQDGSLLIVFDSTSSNVSVLDIESQTMQLDAVNGYDPKLSPDGKLLAYVEYQQDGSSIVKIWDTINKAYRYELAGTSVTFSPDSKFIAVSDAYLNSTKLVNMEEKDYSEAEFTGASSVFSPASNTLLVLDTSTYKFSLWDIKKRTTIVESFYSDAPVFNADGSLIVLSESGKIKIIDLKTKTEILSNISGYYPTFASAGNLLAVQDINGGITNLWNLSEMGTFEPENIIPLLPSVLTFNSDGSALASLANDGIFIWDLKSSLPSPQPLTVDGKANHYLSGSFYASDTRFVAFTENGELLTWDLTEKSKAGIPLENWELNNEFVIKSAFSPNGNFFAYYANNRIGIWNLVEDKAVPAIEQLAEIENFVGTINFSADSSFMAYSDAGKITLYQISPTLKKWGELSTGADQVKNIAIITDGEEVKYVISQDNFDVTQIWDWETRTKAGIAMTGNLRLLGANAQEKSFVYLNSTGRLIKVNWGLRLEDWQMILCELAQRNFTEEEWNTYFPDTEYRVTCGAYPSGMPER